MPILALPAASAPPRLLARSSPATRWTRRPPLAPPRFIPPRSGAALRRLALAIPLLLASGHPVAADVPFTVRTWTLEHGLPASSVQDIAQTPDGYLWLTTTGGIARFDGVRF